MRGSYPTHHGSSTLDPPRSRPRAAFELPLGRRRSHTYATGENQQNASLKCPARVAQLDRIARGKQAGARAPGHLGGSASGGAAAHLWPALCAHAQQRRRAGRPGASLRSGDVGRQGADDNELRGVRRRACCCTLKCRCRLPPSTPSRAQSERSPRPSQSSEVGAAPRGRDDLRADDGHQTNAAQIPCKFQAEKNCTVPSPTSSGRPGPPVTPRASAGSQRRGYTVARRGAADRGSRHRWHLSPTSQPRVAYIRGALRFFAAAEVDA